MGQAVLPAQVSSIFSSLMLLAPPACLNAVRIRLMHAALSSFSFSDRVLDFDLLLVCRLRVFHYLTQKVEELEVTDPYSRGLSADGRRSMFVDLDADAALQPEGWVQHRSPKIDRTLLHLPIASQHRRMLNNI
jgi:hypothetical protein